MSFQAASALDLPFDDGRFDVGVAAACGDEHLRPGAALREIRRVLMLSGRFATF